MYLAAVEPQKYFILLLVQRYYNLTKLTLFHWLYEFQDNYELKLSIVYKQYRPSVKAYMALCLQTNNSTAVCHECKIHVPLLSFKIGELIATCE